jgi:phosphatidylglycerol:prolipoprotein diacylglycerol transferase
MGMIFVLDGVQKSRQNKNLYLDFIFLAIIFGVLGARIYFVIFSWRYYSQDLLKIFAIREGGLAIYGAIISVFILSIFFCKKFNLNQSLFFDTLVPGLLVGQIIGRWGNFFNREAFGKNSNNLFAMRLLASKINNIPNSVMPTIINEVKHIQVHPTFFYESALNFLFLIFILFYKRFKKFSGEIFLLYLLFYGLIRFFIENLRTDQLKFFNVPVSQVFSLIIFITSIIFLVKKYLEDCFNARK